MDYWNKGRIEEERRTRRTHGVVVRCDDETWQRLLGQMKDDGKVYVVFSMSSPFKLILKEEGY